MLKLGSKGEMVKRLQQFLGVKVDGHFGIKTENAVKEYQRKMNITVDGIVGRQTWSVMELATTDESEKHFVTENGLSIIPFFMDNGEYVNEITKKRYLFLHHTMGWNNPYNQIKQWENDDRGSIGTEFVIGGKSIQGDSKYDGLVLQAFPEGYYAWHLGKIGKREVHTDSVGIELCNFGQLVEGRTWAGQKVLPEEIYHVNFRGYNMFHKYSDEQLYSLRKLILYIADRDNIDVCSGLIDKIHEFGVEKAFSWQREAYYGTVEGMWTHANTRTDKLDCFPQDNFIDMLMTI